MRADGSRATPNGVTLDVRPLTLCAVAFSKCSMMTSGWRDQRELRMTHRSDSHLCVDVLQTAHDGTGNRVGPVLPLEQNLRFHNGGVQRCLLAQALNVVGSLLVRVRVLQCLGELFASQQQQQPTAPRCSASCSPRCRGSPTD